MNSWVSPKAKKGLKSKIHGRGFFALKPIKRGEVIAIKNGSLLTWNELKGARLRKDSYLQIGDNLYVGPRTKKEFENSMLFINHSCNPNAGIKGKKTVTAIRNIKKGEEITVDYVTWCSNDLLSITTCNCGSKICRKKITSNDWKNPELQKRYKGYFSSFIQAKINKVSKH